MFETYVAAKTTKRRKWVVAGVTTSIVLHVVALTGLLVRGWWVINKLPTPHTELTIGTAPPPPPPPPPGGDSPKKEKKEKKKIVKETVQPTETKKEETPSETNDSAGEEGGVEGGVVGGVVGGEIGGVLGGEIGGTGSAPPTVEKEKFVPPTALEAQRIAGNERITPPRPVQVAMSRSGKSTFVATVKMCITAQGGIKSLKLMKSSGYPEYDRKLQSEMQKWRYRPFLVSGKAVAVCTAVTFIYKQTE